MSYCHSMRFFILFDLESLIHTFPIKYRLQQCDHFLIFLLLLICIFPNTNPPNSLWLGNSRCHSAEPTSIHSNENIRFGQQKQISHCRTKNRSFSVKVRVSSHHIGIREYFCSIQKMGYIFCPYGREEILWCFCFLKP